MPTPNQSNNSKSRQAVRSFLLGGLLPVIAFSVIEDQWGILWGVVAGMVFGVGEILWEKFTAGKVDPITWGGNGLILVLGGLSFVTQEGVWFKLQPALMEAVFALVLWGSCLLGTPFLVLMARKQGVFSSQEHLVRRPELVARMEELMGGMTLRLGFFFGVHAALACWAALKWSTAAWGILKGVGFTVSFVVYMVVESLLLRYRIATTRN
jgi:intracellular septation protein